MSLPDGPFQRAGKSAIVREINQTMAEAYSAETFEDALDVVANQSRLLIGAHQAAVSYIPGGNFKAAVHAISLSDKYKKYNCYDVMPTGEGIWAIVVEQKIHFCLTHEELVSHPRWKNFSDLLDERGLEHPPMRGWLAVPVPSKSGSFVGLLQLTDKNDGDFTERDLELLKHLAALIAPTFELQHVHEELQRRTDELEHAKQALERSNLELQQFAYIASHDLQSPLRSISGFVQLLQETYAGRLDEQADDWIARTVQGTKRMQTLIQDLLSYSRVDTKARPFAQVDLSQVFDSVMASLEASIRDTRAEVTRSDLPIVLGDESQLVQLLQNLVANAIKYHGLVPPRVAVSAEQNGSEWVVAVRDNGIGIEAKHRTTVFEIFRRLHTQKTYPGTGIGLAICRRVVHRHGGRIWVESESGEGSTFFFTLPQQEACLS